MLNIADKHTMVFAEFMKRHISQDFVHLFQESILKMFRSNCNLKIADEFFKLIN